MLAIYPGSFDPVTNGHLDIIERCAKKFDKLIVAVLENNSKTGMFSIKEREDLLKYSLRDYDNIEVATFSGLLVDYVKERNIDIIVRGLRAISDYEYEMQMALTNKSLYDDAETMFLISNTQYSFLSSSVIKEIAMFNGDITGLVPQIVGEAMEKKIKEGKFNGNI